jgi:hypothetical protein
MEGGGFEATRGPARPGPAFEPPADPAGPTSLHGLSLIAQILRGRELAAEAAGLPPLDSEQVLDLQRSAGNQLTTGALARWIVALGRIDPVLEVQVSCTAGERAPYAVTLQGPAGGATVRAALGAGDAATVVLDLAEAFGDAEGELALRIAGPGGETAAAVPLPLLGPLTLAVGDARFVVA